jgi:5-hydroxyisourate hydrolase
VSITTHILDTSRGRPAVGVHVVLERIDGDRVTVLGRGTTDAEGRLRTLLPEGFAPAPGIHRLRFATGAYFEGLGIEAFHPGVEVVFTLRRPEEHHHVPLLIAPHGYTTYRGS